MVCARPEVGFGTDMGDGNGTGGQDCKYFGVRSEKSAAGDVDSGFYMGSGMCCAPEALRASVRRARARSERARLDSAICVPC